jgi:hypothetical protein
MISSTLLTLIVLLSVFIFIDRLKHWTHKIGRRFVSKHKIDEPGFMK